MKELNKLIRILTQKVFEKFKVQPEDKRKVTLKMLLKFFYVSFVHCFTVYPCNIRSFSRLRFKIMVSNLMGDAVD
ncbi:MAG: hypothetical protein CVU69_10620 [Deltaproteobacteria bacterium HGW-Deltaproteobacteria-4]|nr:MAG: hypothetical protein CVU69_10620 [Deltaproteobacteria bacterium HGW-Deltaproteobacteria-4]